MHDPSSLREQARRCRALAKTAVEPEVIEQLRVWAVELAEEADQVEWGLLRKRRPSFGLADLAEITACDGTGRSFPYSTSQPQHRNNRSFPRLLDGPGATRSATVLQRLWWADEPARRKGTREHLACFAHLELTMSFNVSSAGDAGAAV